MAKNWINKKSELIMILLLVPTIAVQGSLKNNEIYIILYNQCGL